MPLETVFLIEELFKPLIIFPSSYVQLSLHCSINFKKRLTRAEDYIVEVCRTRNCKQRSLRRQLLIQLMLSPPEELRLVLVHRDAGIKSDSASESH